MAKTTGFRPQEPTDGPQRSLGARGTADPIDPSRAESAVARRAAESKATIPHLYLETTAHLDRALALTDASPGADEVTGGYLHLVVRAAGIALREHPQANASYRDGGFALHERVNVGFALEAGPVPVYATIFDADTKPPNMIATELEALAAAVADGSVTAPQLGGSTFSVTSLRGYGITRLGVPVVPPHAGALAVGAPEAGEGSGLALNLTLSCDHRILYGPRAAAFLQRIRTLLESPEALSG